ncbi:methyl-accepting chemotaxis protein [Pelotomaculum propionicicum]|uniref:methyl-accepting chemotaxis protein n=1 Tax=Pelotomaculum propionicicum TaxID=258475 RepID=UPI003B7D9CED
MIGKIFDSIGFKLSITTKIAIALCLLISFLLASVGLTMFFKDQSLIKKEFADKNWSVVHTVSPYAGGFIVSNSPESLAGLVKRVGSNQDVSYAAVLDSAGNVLAHTDSRQVGMKVSGETAKSAMASKSDISSVSENSLGSSVMDFVSPIKDPSGATIGYFMMGADLTGVNEYIKDTIIFNTLVAIIAILAGVLLSVLISKKILKKPLEDLTAATERLAAGDFSYKVPVYKKDELGELATSFNTMTVHLANLIQSVQSSVADINKSAEQILGQLKTSDRTNIKLSQTFDLLKHSSEEQVDILKQSLNLSEQLSEQSNQVSKYMNQVLHEVDKNVQTGEEGSAAMSRITDGMEKSNRSLENTKTSVKQLVEKCEQFNESIDYFKNLSQKNTEFTLKAALLAARAGSQELAQTAEDMHNISEESTRRINDLYAELEELKSSWCDIENALDVNIERIADGQAAVSDVKGSFEKIIDSLRTGKEVVKEAASAARMQSSNILEIMESQHGIIDELLKSANKSTGAGSDTRQQTENLHDIDSLAKKMMRMVDRLNVLSLQFKV